MPRVDATELEKFLINFVVEQTGYPPEVVELDADLEADLGIDSIKKAQLFGELQEYFDVTPTEDLTLDDFPTLRHIAQFPGRRAAARSAATPVADDGAGTLRPSPVAAPAVVAPIVARRPRAAQAAADRPHPASMRPSWKNS